MPDCVTRDISTATCVVISLLTRIWHCLQKTRLIRNEYVAETIILPVVLYGCETWSLTMREERRLGMFENKVLRRICGPNKNEVTGGVEKIT